jgi:hypothetical protein
MGAGGQAPEGRAIPPKPCPEGKGKTRQDNGAKTRSREPERMKSCMTRKKKAKKTAKKTAKITTDHAQYNDNDDNN